MVDNALHEKSLFIITTTTDNGADYIDRKAHELLKLQ